MDFKEKEIKILDRILKIISESEFDCDYRNVNDIFSTEDKWNLGDIDRLENKLKPYGAIIEHYNAGVISERSNTNYYSINSNSNTFKVIEDGGFRTVYYKNLKNQRREENKDELLVNRLRQIKQSRVLSVVAILLSSISIIFTILKYYTDLT